MRKKIKKRVKRGEIMTDGKWAEGENLKIPGKKMNSENQDRSREETK